MSIKVNEFIIQAKVNEGGGQAKTSAPSQKGLSQSEKKEVIDLVMEKVKDYMKRQRKLS